MGSLFVHVIVFQKTTPPQSFRDITSPQVDAKWMCKTQGADPIRAELIHARRAGHMLRKQMFLIGLATFALVAVVLAVIPTTLAQTEMNLTEAVRQATEPFEDIAAAEAAGYTLFHGCVSGPQEGAMGVHYVNGDLVGDGALDATRPEALIYEDQNGRMRLLGVEYVVIAEAWHANNQMPPVLMGQLFNYVGSPNRYGIPAFYELHVWAWKNNPNGTFADWNPLVACDDFVGGH
jgi:hypothetical protein